MACNKCKQKQDEAATQPESLSLLFKLREGITYGQVGLSNPTDEQIKEFIEVNPNRKSLFKLLPDNENTGMSKG